MPKFTDNKSATKNKPAFFKSDRKRLPPISYKTPILKERVEQYIEANFKNIFSQANMDEIEFSKQQLKDLKGHLITIIPIQYKLFQATNNNQSQIPEEDVFYDLTINELEALISDYKENGSFSTFDKTDIKSLKIEILKQILLEEEKRDQELADELNKLSIKN